MSLDTRGPANEASCDHGRVSTKSQDTQNQIRELKKVATRQDWKVTHQYIDHGISGSKGRDGRPEFDKMLKDAVRKEFDVIMAWSVDRLGRSLQHLVGFLDEIHSKGVHLYLHQQGVDTTTPAGKALFQMTGVFAEFERAMIQERVKAGLERARSQGKVLGRPKVSPKVERAILRERKKGTGMVAIAQEVGCGVGTVQRILNDHKA